MVLTYKRVKDVFLKYKYIWFDKPYDLNMFGLRSNNKTPDSFDDIIGVCWVDGNLKENILTFPATTDPGLFYLKNPINVNGTGILDFGQHRKMWRPGKHKGNPALVQVSPCRAIRDYDRDGELDFDSQRKETGLFGCNFHRANANGKTTKVGKWSAMCQVPANASDVDAVLALVKKQKQFMGSDFVSYTLLKMSDFA